eukprot:779271-Alexandrium_andersonii.AAC.1
MADGDLWGPIHEALRARGAGAFRATKVKSHCTERDVEEGKITPENKAGNAKADTLAAEGRDGAGTCALAAQWIEAHEK